MKNKNLKEFFKRGFALFITIIMVAGAPQIIGLAQDMATIADKTANLEPEASDIGGPQVFLMEAMM